TTHALLTADGHRQLVCAVFQLCDALLEAGTFGTTGSVGAHGLVDRFGCRRDGVHSPIVASGSRVRRVARVTGIGGVFLRSRDPVRLAAWYRENLGVP